MESGTPPPQAPRYVTDVAYVPSVIDELAPEWLDLAAVICGFAPPSRDAGYAWCELGCGRGLTPLALAATRPEGRFTGIDLMPGHIAAAREIATRAGIGNVAFHAADFDAAARLDLLRFDYIVAHGVYSWVDAAALAALHRFVDAHLAPGGLVYVSYNALPGWAADAPFQVLVRRLAADADGASDARFAAAAATIGALVEAGAPALRASTIASRLTASIGERPLAYYAHEYLVPHWQPRYVTEVRDAMAAIGLAPVASATLVENFDSLVLRAAARAALAAIPDPDLKALVRDYFLQQRFRRDVFGRDVAPLAAADRAARLLAMRVTLARPACLIEYAMRTAAGTVRFDNAVARAIVARLAAGPTSAGACRAPITSDADLIANLLMLCCAGMAAPAAAGNGDVAALNDVLRDGADAESVLHVLPAGIALRVSRALLEAPHAADTDAARAWAAYLGLAGAA